jgi:tRNA(Arg) A34 adenosine deaminase TadA
MTFALYSRLLDVLEQDVLPLTRKGVESGNKIFGAAVLRSSDRSLVAAGTNEETLCPLWHGEMAAIRNVYRLPAKDRPAPSECLFLSTHEPCSMCLSAIAWGGYRAIYFLFRYEETRDRFQIPHDLRMLEEIFRCADGSYVRENLYWTSHDIVTEVERCAPSERAVLLERVSSLRGAYDDPSRRYQAVKGTSSIPLP